ncbi:MAG: acetyltransferase [Dermatophilaceae bacterium]
MDRTLRIVVLGTGGHARSCLDAVTDQDLDIVGCVGAQPTGALPAPYLGGDEVLPTLREQGVGRAFVAIGDNARRAAVTAELLAMGFELASFVATTARVAPTARLGAGSAVMHHAYLGPHSTLGDGAILNTAATVDHDCVVGSMSHVAPGTHLAGTVVVGDGAFLGVGTSVIPEMEIGEWAIVGAGSVIVRPVRPHARVAGNPARDIGKGPRIADR